MAPSDQQIPGFIPDPPAVSAAPASAAVPGFIPDPVPAETSATTPPANAAPAPGLLSRIGSAVGSEAQSLAQRAESAVAGPDTFLGTNAPGDTWHDLFSDPGKFVKNIPNAVKTLAGQPLVKVDNLLTPEERENHPIVTGGAEFASGLTSPTNLALGAATEGLGELPGNAGKIVKGLVGGAFSAQMVYSAFREIPAFRAALADGDAKEAERIMTHMTLDLAATAYGSQHAIKGSAKPLFPGMDDAVKDYIAKGMDKIKAVPAAAVESAKAAVTPAAKPTPEEVAGKITQATGGDRARAARALSLVDTTKVKTFDDLRNTLDKQVKNNTLEVDKALAQSNAKYGPEQLDRHIPVAGAAPIISNPVTDALDQMQSFYDKTGDDQNLARVQSLQNKYQTEGLTPTEINGIAREHGTNLSGFNANGELSSGLSKQGAENTRSGVKAVVRSLIPDQSLQTLDHQTSDLISARDMADEMKEKVEKLQNKLQKASPLQKAGQVVGKGIDLATGGLVSGILKQIVGTAAKGENTLSPIDIERNLPKNLKLLDDLNAMSPQAAVETIKQLHIAGLLGPAPTITPAPEGESSVTGQPAEPVQGTRAQRLGLILPEQAGAGQIPGERGPEGTGGPNQTPPPIELGPAGKADNEPVAVPAGKGKPGLLQRVKDALVKPPDWYTEGQAAADRYKQWINSPIGDDTDVNRPPTNEKFPWESQEPINKTNVPFQKPTPINEFLLPDGQTTEMVHHHELGHAYVGAEEGLHPIDIASNSHPQSNPLMSAATRFLKQDFQLDPSTSAEEANDKLDKIMSTLFAGAAANELYDGIPHMENTALYGDFEIAKRVMQQAGIPLKDYDTFITAAVDRAKGHLTQPGVSETLQAAAKTREDNLPESHLYSSQRMHEIIQNAREARDAANGKPPAGPTAGGNTARGAAPAGRAAEATASGNERENASATKGKEGITPNPKLQSVAQGYAKSKGMPEINHEQVKANPERAVEIANFYDKAEHAPNDPKVKAAYAALKSETKDQFHYLRDKLGLKFEPQEQDPYKSAQEMMQDIRKNNRLKVFSGSGPGADHPLSEVDPETGETYNTLFRWVHDAMGHAAGGNDFSENGEKSATEAHAQMYSPEARPAMRNETEGQTSWFFHNPEVQAGKAEPGKFAEQKANIIPDENPKMHGLKESSTGDAKADAVIKAAGAVPAGSMMDLAMFHDPKTGSTLALDKDKITPEEVQKHLDESRKKFGVESIPTEKSAYHPDLQKVLDISGPLHDDPSKLKDGPTFVTPDGKISNLPPGVQHPDIIKEATRELGQTHVDTRKDFLDRTGALRTRFFRSRGGDSLSVSVPKTGITDDQMDVIKQAVGSVGRNGNLTIERSDVSRDNPERAKTKEFARPTDVEPLLREIGAHPDQQTETLPAQSDRVSTRVPTAVKSTEDAMGENPLEIGREAVDRAPGLAEKLSNLVRNYPGVKIPDSIKDPDKVLSRFTDHMVGNLKHLYNSVPEEQREQNREWYPSANGIANSIADKHGLSERQGAGVVAALSPQKDWDMNVSLARRVSDIHHEQADTMTSPEMIDRGLQLSQEKVNKDGKVTAPNAKIKGLLKDLTGKTYGELKLPIEKAAWVRLYDEVNNTRDFHQIDPATGQPKGLRKNANGDPSKVAWGSLNEIAKAISIMQDGSRENISKSLGTQHKVRNFYNNIVDPTNPRDVTIDTHAVAAALLRPLAGNDTEVKHNFSGPGSNLTGSSGTYPIIADAYRKAASELGILPRELQSVDWEKGRDLFPDTFKTKKNKLAVDDIWRQYDAGKLSLDKAREAVIDFAEEKKPAGKISALDFLNAFKKK